MGDVSIIARRLKDGLVQYGWSGNGGYFRTVGYRLCEWYDAPEMVDYLFGLGETRLIGQPGSEKGGASLFSTHQLTGMPYHYGITEREIFSQIAFIDYGYFYDLDEKWYYIVPGPFRIKIPLNLIKNNLNEDGYEFTYLDDIRWKIIEYILGNYYEKDAVFKNYISKFDVNQVLNALKTSNFPIHKLFEEYREIFDYFDDWIVICADKENNNISEIIMKAKEEEHIETIEWNKSISA